jgi:hypothetical protein
VTGQCKALFVHATQKAPLYEQRIVLQWLTNFVATVKPNVTAKILLLLDGHSTHTNSTDAPQLARDSSVVVILLQVMVRVDSSHWMCSY